MTGSTLTLRQEIYSGALTKGEVLSFEEVDDNFIDLDIKLKKKEDKLPINPPQFSLLGTLSDETRYWSVLSASTDIYFSPGTSIQGFLQNQPGFVAGTFGSTSKVPVITVSQTGIITSLSEATLSGTLVNYNFVNSPDILFAVNQTGAVDFLISGNLPTRVASSTFGSLTKIPQISVNTKGLITGYTEVDNYTFVDSTDTDITVLSGSVSIDLQTRISNPGTYGGTSSVPILTVNSKGLLTAISSTTISAGGSGGRTCGETVFFDISQAVLSNSNYFISNIGQNTFAGWVFSNGSNNTADVRGRTIVGFNSFDTDFDTIRDSGGFKTHTLTIPEIPSHNHTLLVGNGDDGDGGDIETGRNNGFRFPRTDLITQVGGGAAHNNLQPYTTLLPLKWVGSCPELPTVSSFSVIQNPRACSLGFPVDFANRGILQINYTTPSPVDNQAATLTLFLNGSIPITSVTLNNFTSPINIPLFGLPLTTYGGPYEVRFSDLFFNTNVNSLGSPITPTLLTGCPQNPNVIADSSVPATFCLDDFSTIAGSITFEYDLYTNGGTLNVYDNATAEIYIVEPLYFSGTSVPISIPANAGTYYAQIVDNLNQSDISNNITVALIFENNCGTDPF